MRVAMCISGQLRDEELSLPLIANVARELKPQVFISTWKLRGTKTSGAMDQYQIRRMWGNELYFGLPARLVGGLSLPNAIPAFADLLEQQIRENEPSVTVESMEKYFENPIVDIEDESKFCLDFIKPVTDVNSLRMLYKVWKCNELKRRHEKDTGQKFDVVVRLRPDFMLKPLAPDIMEAICQDPGKLMFVAQGRRSFVGDTVAVSGSAGADYYAALFAKALLAPARPWRGSHEELYDHLVEGKFDIRERPLGTGLPSSAIVQRENRRILIDLIDAGNVAPGIFPRQSDWQQVAIILRAANLLAANDFAACEAVISSAEFSDLSPAAVQPDIAAALLMVTADLFLRRGQFRWSYVAALLSWVYRALHALLSVDWQDPIVTQSHAAMLAALTPAEYQRAYTWETAAALLATADLPAVLKGPATAVLTGGLQETARLALAYLGKFEQLGIPLDSLSRYCTSLLGAPGSPAAGQAAARQIIAAAPNDPRGYDFLSHFRQRVGDIQGALEFARAALERGPLDGGLHCRVGCVLMYQLSRPAEAEPHLRRGTELWPDPRAWYWYAEALERTGRFGEARKAIAEAVRRDPGNTNYQAAATRLGGG